MGPEIIVPIGAFAMIVAIVCLPFYFKSRERREMQRTLRVAIEKGQPIPTEVIEAMSRSVKTPPTRLRDLRTGVIWLAVGIGLALFSFVTNMGWQDPWDNGFGNFMLGLSVIPATIGAAFLVLGLLNKNRD